MRTLRSATFSRFATAMFVALAVVAVPVTVFAQATGLPTAPTTPGPGATPVPGAPVTGAPTAAASGGGWGIAVALVLGLLIIVAIGVKIFDLKRKRDAEAVHLQAQISDALLRDQSMASLPITPTAKVPLWSGTPAKVEIAGRVPSADLREPVLRMVRAEAVRVRPDVEIEDRLSVAA